MKHSIIKYSFCFVLMTLFVQSGNTQSKSKFSLRSVSIGAGTFKPLTDSYVNNLGGFNMNADLAFEMDEYIFSIYYGTGVQTIIIEEERYSEINITAGKEFDINDWFAIEGHLGIGLFNYKYDRYSGVIETDSQFGLPLRIKGNFYFNENFVLGINPNLNINTYYSMILSGNLFIQYVF